MKTSFLYSTVVLCFVAGAITVGQTNGIQLRYAFQKEKVYKYKTTMKFFNDAGKKGSAAAVKPSAEMTVGVSLSAVKNSSTLDQRWKFVVDTVGMQMVSPAGDNRVLTLEQLKGKSMELVIDDRGVPKGVQAVEPSSLNQTRELGFELFSKDLLSVTLAFPQYPEKNVELNQPWRFSRADTVSRGGQQIIVTRTTECKLVGRTSVGNQMCHKIAYTVTTRFRGQASSGETTATGLLFCTDQGIPIESDASIKAVITAGGTETIQKRTVKTMLE